MPNKVDYGRGLPGLGSLRLDGTLTRGLENVARDVYHMLITVRGSLPADPEAGLGLLDMILAPTDQESIPGIADAIESELAKDERIASSEATVTPNPATGSLDIDIAVTMADGPSFRLVGPIANVRVELIANGN